MANPITHRYDFVYMFDVEQGNPNGDPDAGNMPRIDPETNHGIVTDVALKRKIRNYVELKHENSEGNRIYIREKAVLTEMRADAYEGIDAKSAKADQVSEARTWMCANFYDVRTFGAVMSATENNAGQVRGPVQLTFARSVDPILPLEVTITRMAVETPKEAVKQEGDNRTMGRKHIVPYGVYRGEGFVSAKLARQTGFAPNDLDLLWEALANMFDHDHSAARGKMAARALLVFEHESELGNAPSHRLFDLVSVRRTGDAAKPARSFGDYNIVVDEDAIPDGVRLLRIV
ncbi:MAG: type I-C CRISPR-associated protein Cas7/Csd2 [bacterium]